MDVSDPYMLVCMSVRLKHGCGEVLMSSHRAYEKDFEWSWLRNQGRGIDMLHFEPVEDSENLYELVVDRNWSTLVCDILSLRRGLELTIATGGIESRGWDFCHRRFVCKTS